MVIQLVAVDLDDTLLQEDLRISRRNLEAVRAAREQGIIVGIATGRMYESLLKYAQQLELFGTPGFIISAGGGMAIETETMTTLHQQTLPVELTSELLRFFETYEVPVEIHHDGCSYATRDGVWVREDCRLAGLDLRVVDDMHTRIQNMPVYKLLIAEDRDRIPRLYRETMNTFGNRISTVVSKPEFLEVLPQNVNKGTALRRIAEYFHVPMHQCLAIGDGHNDMEMIRIVGCGVVVRNASDDLKRIATHVTSATNDESAVAETLERFLTGDSMSSVAT